MSGVPNTVLNHLKDVSELELIPLECLELKAPFPILKNLQGTLIVPLDPPIILLKDVKCGKSYSIL